MKEEELKSTKQHLRETESSLEATKTKCSTKTAQLKTSEAREAYHRYKRTKLQAIVISEGGTIKRLQKECVEKDVLQLT